MFKGSRHTGVTLFICASIKNKLGLAFKLAGRVIEVKPWKIFEGGFPAGQRDLERCLQVAARSSVQPVYLEITPDGTRGKFIRTKVEVYFKAVGFYGFDF